MEKHEIPTDVITVSCKDLINARFASRRQSVECYFAFVEKATIHQMQILGGIIGKSTGETAELFISGKIKVV